MRALPCVLGLFLLCSTTATADVRPLRDWRQMRSPNFLLLGDVSEGDLRKVAGRLEQFRAAVGVMLPKATVTTATPTTVIVFRSHRNYQPFKPVYNGKVADHIGGYFLPGQGTNYITLTTEMRGGGGDDERFRVIQHELVHLMVRNSTRGMPVWFNEGLAEYYSTLDVAPNGSQVLVGKVISHHLFQLRERSIPLEQLVAVDHGSPLYNEGSKASIFYAQSWALVHYLILAEKQKRVGQLPAFLNALADGVPLGDASQKVFAASPAQLQKELQGYVGRDTFTIIELKFAERLAEIERLPSTPVSDAAAHATMGGVLLAMGRSAEANEQLQQALALDSAQPDALAILGYLYVREGKYDLARTHLLQAATHEPASAQTHYLLALALTQLRNSGNDAGTDAEARTDAALRRALTLDPALTDAYAMLAHRLASRGGNSNEPIALLSKAIELSPGREELRLNLAYLLANRQRFADARAVLGPLMAQASDPTIKEGARSLMARLADYEQRKAGSDVVELAPDGPRRMILDLRKVGEGESQLRGRLLAIECPRGSIQFAVEHENAKTTSRVHSRTFDTIEFITYRENDTGGSITCGERPPDDDVLVTYRPAPEGNSLGEVVAIEFLPKSVKVR